VTFEWDTTVVFDATCHAKVDLHDTRLASGSGHADDQASDDQASDDQASAGLRRRPWIASYVVTELTDTGWEATGG
jgi:hypothetical protein